MEESFEKTEGILEAISGYSGGIHSRIPTYKEVTHGLTPAILKQLRLHL